MKLFRDIFLDQRLCLAVSNCRSSRAPAPVECAPAHAGSWRPLPQPAQFAEKKDAIRSRIGDARKFLQPLSNVFDAPRQSVAEIAAKLILDAFGNLLQPHRPQFRHHAAGFQRVSQLRLRRMKKPTGLNSNFLVECIPSPRAGRVARRISAVPPDQERIWIYRPAGLLRPVERFQLVENGSNVRG